MWIVAFLAIIAVVVGAEDQKAAESRLVALHSGPFVRTPIYANTYKRYVPHVFSHYNYYQTPLQQQQYVRPHGFRYQVNQQYNQADMNYVKTNYNNDDHDDAIVIHAEDDNTLNDNVAPEDRYTNRQPPSVLSATYSDETGQQEVGTPYGALKYHLLEAYQPGPAGYESAILDVSRPVVRGVRPWEGTTIFNNQPLQQNANVYSNIVKPTTTSQIFKPVKQVAGTVYYRPYSQTPYNSPYTYSNPVIYQTLPAAKPNYNVHNPFQFLKPNNNFQQTNQNQLNTPQAANFDQRRPIQVHDQQEVRADFSFRAPEDEDADEYVVPQSFYEELIKRAEARPQ